MLRNPQAWQTIRRGMEMTHTDPPSTGLPANAFRGAQPILVVEKPARLRSQRSVMKTNERPDIEDVAEHLRDKRHLYWLCASRQTRNCHCPWPLKNVGGGGRNAAPIARALMDYYFADEESRQAHYSKHKQKNYRQLLAEAEERAAARAQARAAAEQEANRRQAQDDANH